MNDVGPFRDGILEEESTPVEAPRAFNARPDGGLDPVIAEMPVPTIITDPNLPDDPIVSVNKAFLDLTGYSADEVLGERYDFLFGAGADPAVTAQVDDALRCNRDIVVDLQTYRKDGTPVRTALFVTSIFDRQNRPIHRLASYIEHRGTRGGPAEIDGVRPGGDAFPSLANDAREMIEANRRLVEANCALQETARATERLRAEAASARQALDAVLSSISDGFMTVDRAWRFTRVNAKAAAIAGLEPEVMIGRNVWDLFPDTVGTLLHRKAHFAAARRTPVEFEYFCPRLDRWFEYRFYPSSEGLTVLENDITARKAAERRQRVLTAELQHRVKNNLALIRSLSTRTLRRARSLEDFAAIFEGRLHALAVTQSLLSRGGAEEVDLHELLLDELLPYDAREGENLEIHGPEVLLKPKTAQLLGLVFHELATNAMKYGALVAGGRIEVTWTIEPTVDGGRLDWRWIEAGVSDIDRSASAGFGRDLVERGVPYQLGGASRFEIGSDGIRCVIQVPLTENVGKLRPGELAGQ
ncbi:HWE histidine kinase domain-containing protein [Rhodospirillaceae bacterium SYSU D60014]|uniref:HWE histidine kinase domain-containing protein n=1 Tax=Virgifigura deserti TaxID=2268457 RepID=UPI000E663FE4